MSSIEGFSETFKSDSQRKRKLKYEQFRFDLKECEAYIDLVEKFDDEGYATGYLNVKLPDGRWVVFSTPKKYVVPLFKEKEVSE